MGVRLNAISHEKSKKEKGWRGKVGETGKKGRMEWRMDEKSRGGRKKATREVTSAVNNLSFKTSLRL